VGLALIAMISGSTPLFCKSFLSSMTQMGLLVGLKPAQASLSFSCALAGETGTTNESNPAKTKTILVTMTGPSLKPPHNYHFAVDEIKQTLRFLQPKS
jgi:pyrroline-5-carboxylate reductase